VSNTICRAEPLVPEFPTSGEEWKAKMPRPSDESSLKRTPWDQRLGMFIGVVHDRPHKLATLRKPPRRFGASPHQRWASFHSHSLLPGAYPPDLVTGLRRRENLAGSGQHCLQVIEHDSNRYLQVLLAKIGLGHGKTAGFK
jgi:hypothetical protein